MQIHRNLGTKPPFFMSTHYEVLSVAGNATPERIKQRFQQLILEHHPDKRSNEGDSNMAHRILQAWEVLRDPKRRQEYDIKLKASTKSIAINAEVDLDDMSYDETISTYSTTCRCSGVYSITENALEQGIDIICCDQCSLRIRVLYDVIEEA